MAVRIVMLGDVVGDAGRTALLGQLPAIRERYRPGLVIVNAENAVNGSGLTPAIYRELCEAGVDGITLGDHVYKKQQITRTLERETNIIRPANLPAAATGAGSMRLTIPLPGGQGEVAVYVLTLLGRLFMSLPASDPFETADWMLRQIADPEGIVLVEVHAEATSEKQALGWYLNRRVTAVIGTHTHVPTADARILPADPTSGSSATYSRPGTAYISDIGMTGPYDSVLGRRVDRVLHHMTTAMPAPFDVATGNPRVCGVVIDIDPETRLATAIQRIDLAG